MKLNRNKLRKLILQEIKRLQESSYKQTQPVEVKGVCKMTFTYSEHPGQGENGKTLVKVYSAKNPDGSDVGFFARGSAAHSHCKERFERIVANIPLMGDKGNTEHENYDFKYLYQTFGTSE